MLIKPRNSRWACVLALLVTACPFGGPSEGPCRQDSLQCGDGVAFEVDDSCENTEPLRVSLGAGEESFTALLPGDDPPLVQGFQGGQHLVLGLRIDNADPDHLLFEVEFDLEQAEGSDWTRVASRDAVYDEMSFEQDRSEVRILDIVVIPDVWDLEAERVIAVSVRDSCGRSTAIDHVIDGD